MEREIAFIVLHCSATRSDCEYSEKQLDKDHKNRGFASAGYHFYVRKTGKVVTMRPLHMIPAHVSGHNRNSIGVCYEGGLDPLGEPADTRTDAQLTALTTLLSRLKKNFPRAIIMGHRDLSPDLNNDGVITPREWIKACPCFNAKNEYKHL